MNTSLASLLCYCGIAGLFYLDREKTNFTSKALWIPSIWIALVGSRSISTWFNLGPSGPNAQLEGSPIDALVYGLLSAAAIAILIRRSSRTRAILVTNWPIVIYFVYCLVSVTWSYHPDVSLKRWIKAVGDLAMVLVIVTERQPIASLRRLISRVGFVLLPTSLLLIKYYGDLGRGYTPDGLTMNTGVSTDKNMFGVMLLVVSLGTVWHLMNLLRAKRQPERRRHLLAQSTLLVFAIVLLKMANSQTSIACFVLGSGIILATNLRTFKRQPARVHALCLAIVIIGVSTLLLGGGKDVVHAMGRQSSLSGRTEIWAALIPAAANPIVGAGFESFWISPNVIKFQRALVGWYHPESLNEAHNGYLEVYLNLGWMGVGIIALILITGYKRAVAVYKLNPSVGSLLLAYIMAAAVYSITEAGFRMLDCIWIFLLIAVVSASGIAAGVIARNTPIFVTPDRAVSKVTAGKRLASVTSTVYTGAD